VGEPVEKINISILQKTTPEGIEVYFLCAGGNFECQDVPIAFEIYKTENAIYLEFGDTYGGDCSRRPDGWPAHSYVHPGKLEVGNYLLEITNRKKTLHCNLKVEAGKYIFSNTSSGTVEFVVKEDPLVVNF